MGLNTRARYIKPFGGTWVPMVRNSQGMHMISPSTQLHVALEVTSSCVLPGCTARTWKMYTWLKGTLQQMACGGLKYDTL